MPIGKVIISQDKGTGGSITEIERKVLFIGIGGATALADQIHAINQETDLDIILGPEDSELKLNIEAARLNAGPNFTGYVIPILAALGLYTWDTAIEFALDQPNDIDVEMVVLTTAMASSADVDLYQASCVAAQNVFAKYITIHAAVTGITGALTWANYLTTTKALQTNKAANRVHLVPQLHGNNLGVVVGRLINDSYSLGDSPMRVASGAVVGLGVDPVDVDGVTLSMAHLTDLADNRFSVPQTYTGIDGTYWADHVSLDIAGGDFQVFENTRVIDYLTRRIRVLAILKIADRSLNSAPDSVAYHEGYFMQPIFDASKASNINGVPKPGLVKPPQDGDIVISWLSTTEVELFMLAAPLDSPKKITAHISLDLGRIA